MEEESEMTEQEMELDIDDEEDEMDMDMDMDSDDESEMEDEDEGEEMLMMDLPGDELEVDDEEEVLLPLDLTGASDEEILKVFKAMGEEDGIIVTQDGGDVTLKDEEADVEYKIQMESEEEVEMEEMDEEVSEEDMDEVVYEIEVSEEDEMEEEWKEEASEGKYGMNKGDEYHRKDVDGHEKEDGKYGAFESEMSEEEMEGEAVEGMVRSHAAGQNASSDKSKGLPRPHSVPNKARLGESAEKEIQQLREKNEEYRKALNIFKEKLNEVAVFNSNLAYATRLFTEHTTTKQEKINILRRFDSVETLKESKGLYKTLKEEFDAKSAETIAESVSTKVSKTPAKGSSANLIESKTYENPQFLRMKDLMSKIIK
jgi:hypothetical protein